MRASFFNFLNTVTAGMMGLGQYMPDLHLDHGPALHVGPGGRRQPSLMGKSSSKHSVAQDRRAAAKKRAVQRAKRHGQA